MKKGMNNDAPERKESTECGSSTYVSAVVVSGLEEAGEERSDVSGVGGHEDNTEGTPHVDEYLVGP